MALYAFDGTWNADDEEGLKDTNVVKFRELYAGKAEYIEGVGTRAGKLGKVVGGLFGAGGHSRIDEMFDALRENWRAGDRDIDIVGFSRGAALAVHFANEVTKKGIDGQVPRIRFLGLWDVVGSFGLNVNLGIDFQSINLGWDIDHVASTVQATYHAMALDERRETFVVTRLDPANRLPAVEERWFRGVHSDVGGGNQNPLRSNIALKWMVECARNSDVPIDPAKQSLPRYGAIDLDAPISDNLDPQRDERRLVGAGDTVDETALAVQLGPGDSHTCTVSAARRYNWSRVRLVGGREYRVTTGPHDDWTDADQVCTADGWPSSRLSGLHGEIVKAAEHLRRYPDANWFELIGAHDDEDREGRGAALVRLGAATHPGGAAFQAARDADLYLFANDLPLMYGNNQGEIRATITRLA